MLFKKVNKEHIIQGIKDFEEKGLPKEFGTSSTYDLIFEDKKYPPKAIMAYANFHAEGRKIERYFKGGLGTDCFNAFDLNGFNVVKKEKTVMNENLHKLKQDFLDYWPLEKLQSMTLEEYTDTNRENSFCYWLEHITRDLGSIVGGSSYKFGIYKMGATSKTQSATNRKNDGIYAWHTKYGESAIEAFESIKKTIIDIASFAKEDKLSLIDEIDLGAAYKWKIAFLYSNYKVVNIFTKEALRFVAKSKFNQQEEFEDYGELNTFILSKKEDQDFFAFSKELWLHYDANNSKAEEFKKWLKINNIGKSNKSSSYLNAIKIIITVFKIEVYTEDDIDVLQDLYEDLLENQKEKNGKYAYEKKSYGEKGFYSAAIKTYIQFLTNDGASFVSEEEEIYSKEIKEKSMEFPLNQILYGPPGTGKTYKTKELAVQISNPNFIYDTNWSITERREEIVKEYDRLCEKGQIVFTTFHQSMSYEDFVEGIKPKTVKTKITYDVEDGVFKLLSDKAKDNWEANNKRFEKELAFDSVFSKLREEWEEDDSIKFPMKTDGNDFTIIGFTNKSIQFKKASGGTSHTLSINTLRNIFYDESKNRTTGVGIYYPSILAHLKKYKTQTDIQVTLNNYVLIIDEINRGNVSAIFGELITLLEDDKRIGQKEAIKITLPYSKDEFGVPSNLYIIGTMNTADRSVEALDTALRRRFSFTEVAPNSELLEDKEVEEEIDLKKLLQTINDRIELLIDKDHKIGHSYFLNIETLEDLKLTFKNKVIPLLEEYFFGDYGKIGLVLGDGFIKLKDDKDKIYFAKNFTEKYEDAENLREKAVYTFTDEDSWDKSTFISIYEQ